MNLKSGFFNSINHDRKYNAEDISQIINTLVTDGIIPTKGDEFMTVAGSGMTVNVKSGLAWFDSTWSLNENMIPLRIEAADVSRARIDAIVIDIDKSNNVRDNQLKVVKGTPALTPLKPTLANGPDHFQHAIAYISVPALATSITAANIDIRVGQDDCPFATGKLESISITDLYNQWEYEFDTWLDNLKTQLGDNVAANLQRQIEERVKISDKATDSDIQNKRSDKWISAEKFKSNSSFSHGGIVEGCYLESETSNLIPFGTKIPFDDPKYENALNTALTIGQYKLFPYLSLTSNTLVYLFGIYGGEYAADYWQAGSYKSYSKFVPSNKWAYIATARQSRNDYASNRMKAVMQHGSSDQLMNVYTELFSLTDVTDFSTRSDRIWCVSTSRYFYFSDGIDLKVYNGSGSLVYTTTLASTGLNISNPIAIGGREKVALVTTSEIHSFYYNGTTVVQTVLTLSPYVPKVFAGDYLLCVYNNDAYSINLFEHTRSLLSKEIYTFLDTTFKNITLSSVGQGIVYSYDLNYCATNTPDSKSRFVSATLYHWNGYRFDKIEEKTRSIFGAMRDLGYNGWYTGSTSVSVSNATFFFDIIHGHLMELDITAIGESLNIPGYWPGNSSGTNIASGRNVVLPAYLHVGEFYMQDLKNATKWYPYLPADVNPFGMNSAGNGSFGLAVSIISKSPVGTVLQYWAQGYQSSNNYYLNGLGVDCIREDSFQTSKLPGYAIVK